MARKQCVWAVLLLFALCAPTKSNAQDSANKQGPQPNPTNADVAAGKEIFARTCSGCHGVDASGGMGPDIRGIPQVLGTDRVAQIMTRGIPGTGMNGFPLLRSEALQVAAYLSSLGTPSGAGTVKGNPEEGKELYEKEGCSTCHIIAGKGGELGPDLSRIGAERAVDYLRGVLLDPGAHLPKEAAQGEYRGRWDEYLMFRAATKDGRVIQGMRVGEDSFGIVLKDAGGGLRSLHKVDLRSLTKEPGKSFMPSYKGALTSTELEDLIAYLSSLKGAP